MEEKRIFAKNLNYYLDKYGKTQIDLINDLGFNKSTVSTWCNGIKMPRMGTIQTLADYFGIMKSDLIEEIDQITRTNTESNERIHKIVKKLPPAQLDFIEWLADQPEEKLEKYYQIAKLIMGEDTEK